MLIIPEQVTNGMQVFRYTSYWGKWSRMIAFGPKPGWYLELDLMPIPNFIQDWDKIKALNFRYHCTQSCVGDKFTRKLPPDIFEVMLSNLGVEIVNYMLTEDFYPQIDLRLLKDNANGGCPLIKCLKIRMA